MPALRALFVGLLLAACARDERSTAGANLLLVTLDTTRADALGCYGGERWATRCLDALAQRGIRFADARTVTPVTLPAHASILTGLLPFEHGVRDNTTFRLPAGTATLAERLQAEGYATGAVVATFVLHSDFGLAQGFDVYSDIPRRQLETVGFVDRRSAAEVVDAALALARELEPPWFLWVHFYDPHRPYDPPAELGARALAGRDPTSLSESERWRAAYTGEVAYMDGEIARLLAGLPGSAPLVCVVADHGEGLGEHGEEDHGQLCYDTTMRVPFLLAHPALAARVVDTPVSVVDVAPTLLALLGMAPLAGASGADLTPLLQGGAAPARPVYFEAANAYYSYGWSPLFGLLLDDLKIIEGPRPEVFDPARDPDELRDLSRDHGELLERARAELAALAPRTAASERVEVLPEDARQLAAIGYVASAAAEGELENAWPPGRLRAGLRDPKDGMTGTRRLLAALALEAAGDVQGAVRDVRAIVRDDPTNPYFLGHAGTVYSRAGLHAEAAETLRRALELREDANARGALGVTYYLMGRPEEALRELRLNAELHPRHLHTRLALGEILLKLGRPSEAVPWLEQFLAAHEGDDHYHREAQRMLDEARGKR